MVVDPAALLGQDGVRASAEVVAASGRSSVVRWVRRGRLLRPLPGVLVDPARAHDWRTRAAAAAVWSGGRLTGRSALHLADLLGEPGPRVHIGVSPSRHVAISRPPWLEVHLRRELSGPVRAGLAVVDDVAALLDAWGFAHSSRGTAREVEVARSAVIGAIRRRRADPAALVAALELNLRLPGRAQLLHLVELAGGGSHSEFEIWGLEHLFDIPGLPPVERQYALETAIGTIHLDGALPRARLGIELDGAAFHRSPENWAGDRRRDAATMALDWATLRIDFRRAHEDLVAARTEIATTYWARLARIEQQSAVI